MTLLNFRRRLLSGAAPGIFAALSIMGVASEARADSLCAADTTMSPDKFACLDPDDTQTATGTYTEGANLGPISVGGLYIASTGALDVSFTSGQINTAGNMERAVFLDSTLGSGGALTYLSTGTTSTIAAVTNTVLLGNSVTANTGTVLTAGSFALGVLSIARNGSNNTTGGATTVARAFSIGLSIQATNGDIVANSGTINATASGSIGIKSFTLLGTSCGTNTVNATGDIHSDSIAIYAVGCGANTITVQAGTSVTKMNTNYWPTIVNYATTTATTIIDGNVSALSASHYVLGWDGTSSTTVLNSGAVLTGFVAGGIDGGTFTINPGATWDTGGTSWFSENQYVLTNAGTISAKSGETNFLGLTTLANNGIIDLQDGVPDDVLTIDGDYVGGGSLLIDVSETGADRLVVGGTITGTTTLFINGAEKIDSKGISVVIVDSGSAPAEAFALGTKAASLVLGTKSASFVLGTKAASQLIDLRLIQSGDELFLSAAPNSIAFQPLAVGNVVGAMWYQSADTYSAHAHLTRNDRGGRNKRSGLWGQLYASHERDGDEETQTVFDAEVDLDSRMQTDRNGAQLGVDFSPSGSGVIFGVTGGYQHASADYRSFAGGVDADGYNIGGYAQFGGASGFYGAALVKRDWNDVRLTHSAFDISDDDPNATSTGIEGNAGFGWGSGPMNFDVGAGLAYVRTKIDKFSVDGIDYNFDRSSSLRGRMGARVGFGGKMAPFIDAKIFHEFKGDSRLSLLNGDELDSVKSDGRGTWARLEAGIGAQKGLGPSIAGWAEFGDVKGLGIRAGFRF